MYKIEFRLTEDALKQRQEKYPNFFKTNRWRTYEKYKDVKKRDAAFEEFATNPQSEFEWRPIDPPPEEVEDGQ